MSYFSERSTVGCQSPLSCTQVALWLKYEPEILWLMGFFFSMVEFLLLFSSVQQVFSELMSLITYTGYFCLANTERKLQDTSFWGKMVTLYNKFPLVKVR